jgi:hypothetical protein
MPLADRDPLRAAEARVCELERQLDVVSRTVRLARVMYRVA